MSFFILLQFFKSMENTLCSSLLSEAFNEIQFSLSFLVLNVCLCETETCEWAYLFKFWVSEQLLVALLLP